MFKNMKVKKSLMFGFGITIVVSLVLIISSVIAINVLSDGYNNLINSNIKSNEMNWLPISVWNPTSLHAISETLL